jgi:hypothetical protein
MDLHKTMVAALTVLLSAFCWATPCRAVPQVTIGPCTAPPQIDGRLDDACWRAAATLGDFVTTGENRKAARATSVKLLYDAKWLYLGIACRHENPAQMSRRVLDHDGPVHADESVEIVFDPGSNGILHYHFLLNAANTQAEQRMSEGSRDRSWSPQWCSGPRFMRPVGTRRSPCRCTCWPPRACSAGPA